jgi:hypothetical protein
MPKLASIIVVKVFDIFSTFIQSSPDTQKINFIDTLRSVYWDSVPCSLVDVKRCLTGAYYLHDQGLIITLIIEAVHTSVTAVNFYETTQNNITEHCLLHTHHCESLKSFLDNVFIVLIDPCSMFEKVCRW